MSTEFVFLREPRVLERLDISRRTLWRWVKAGRFPRPVQVGPNIVRWRSDQVQEWCEARVPAAVRRPDLVGGKRRRRAGDAELGGAA